MNLPSSPQIALAFLAHPDDAEFLCTGTLLRLASIGWEIHIATATPGDCGSMTLPASEIAEIRRREGANAAAQMSATYHCLEESDVRVVFDKPTCQKAIDLFRQIGPSLVFTHPRYDYMLDHEQVHLLARAAAFSYPIPNASSLPRPEHSKVPWLYYCDPLEGQDPYSGQLVLPSVCIDVSEQIVRKMELLACHQSQREWLREHHGMDEYTESMKRLGALRGQPLGVNFAEAFIQHRGHAYPQTDLLQDSLGNLLAT